MPSYLVEAYTAEAAVADGRARARRAAELGAGVRYVRTTFLPDDETTFHVFEAPSANAVRRAARLAALQYQRVLEARERAEDAGEGGAPG
jgi:Protein of unknown function (DUF4242)